MFGHNIFLLQNRTTRIVAYIDLPTERISGFQGGAYIIYATHICNMYIYIIYINIKELHTDALFETET